MSCFRIFCKHYDIDKPGCCSLSENDCVDKNKYLIKYCCNNCVNFRADKASLKRCTILKCTYLGAPCEAPRLKSNGDPVVCTFYKSNDG